MTKLNDNEGHFLEYKDFSKVPAKESEIKSIKSKLFKEISAFSNSEGGEIIVGIDDETKEKIPQPLHILELLEKDNLTRIVNSLSDNLIILDSKEKEKIVTISIQKSEDIIAAATDAKNIYKGDIFIRKNGETVKATTAEIAKLLNTKKPSSNTKIQKLKKIVHQKFADGNNNSSNFNIFDSMVIGHTDINNEFINSVFDHIMCTQFYLSYSLPLSQFTTLNVYLNIVDTILGNKELEGSRIAVRQNMLNKLKESSSLSDLMEGWRDEVVNSRQFENYLSQFEV